MTYNIRSLRDDAAAVVRVIRSAEPDVVCVQEAPRFLFWRAKCRWLAAKTQLRIAGGGRSAAANLLLTGPDIQVEAERSVLFSKDPRLHQRGVAMARLRVHGAAVVVAGTHLDGYPEPRLRHVRELFEALDEFTPPGVPTVLAGDFNDDPGTPVWDALLARGTDAFAAAGEGDGFTLNVTHPTRRLDAIFAGPGVRVRAARWIDSPDVRIASDHRPVIADLELREASDA
ncbi:MAG: Endonuclease/exonuclease/phosphatase [Pseudonocardiales bacterium]|nr:Endonuclease/exonuclease/phosphatase [Pseudonocardiales bacterium]